jgi:hypothetical protein
LQRKFAWVNQSRVKWNPSGRIDGAEDEPLEQDEPVEQEDHTHAGEPVVE